MDKIPVAVLGATGAVGQRFVQLLADHPWFEISALTGSERSVGGVYREVCRWVHNGDIPPEISEMVVSTTDASLPARIVFSALPNRVARQVEGWPGLLVTSPNCTATGLVMTLKPLHDAFGVAQVFATTLQAVSGAGYPGVPYLDIIENIIPDIPGEAEKIQDETRLLLGRMDAGQRVAGDMELSVQTNRVPVFDGHTVNMTIKFDRPPSPEEAVKALSGFRGPDPVPSLPSAPAQPVLVRSEPNRPQPRRDRDAAAGMAVTVGSIQPCPILDLRMVSVVHNTLRGAASGSILNAELLVAEGYAKNKQFS